MTCTENTGKEILLWFCLATLLIQICLMSILTRAHSPQTFAQTCIQQGRASGARVGQGDWDLCCDSWTVERFRQTAHSEETQEANCIKTNTHSLFVHSSWEDRGGPIWVGEWVSQLARALISACVACVCVCATKRQLGWWGLQCVCWGGRLESTAAERFAVFTH